MSFDTPPVTPRGGIGPLPIRDAGDARGAGSDGGIGSSSSGPASSSSSGSAGEGAGGGAGFRLRGSSPPPVTGVDVTETLKTLVQSSIRKIDLGKLSDKIAKYPGFRDILETEVLGCGVEDDKIQVYIEDMNALAEEEIVKRDLPKDLKEVDNNLYRAVKKAVQAGDNLEELQNKIIGEVKRGHGRRER